MTGGPELKWAELNPMLISAPCPLNTDPSETSEKQQWTPGSCLKALDLFSPSAASFQCLFHRSSASLGFPAGTGGKAPACQCKRLGFDPWVGKIPWRRAWKPTPVFLPRESDGQRSLVGYSPWGCKELDTSEWLSMHAHFIIHHMSFQWQFPWPLIVLPSDLPGRKKKNKTQLWVNQTILSLHAYTWTADHSRDNPKPALTDATEIHGHQPRAAPYPGSICPFFIVVISNNLHWLLTCCSSCGPILHHVFLCPDSLICTDDTIWLLAL